MYVGGYVCMNVCIYVFIHVSMHVTTYDRSIVHYLPPSHPSPTYLPTYIHIQAQGIEAAAAAEVVSVSRVPPLPRQADVIHVSLTNDIVGE